MPTQKPRYTVIVDEEMLKKIDDYRFENRFPSRSAATIELIKLGMEQLEKEQAQSKKRNRTLKLYKKQGTQNRTKPANCKAWHKKCQANHLFAMLLTSSFH